MASYDQEMLASYKAAREAVEEKEAQLQADMDQLEEMQASAEAEHDRFSGLISQTQSSISAYSDQIATAEAQVEALEAQMAAQDENIEALQKQLEEERERENVQLKNSEEVHLALAALEQQNTFILENISRIREEMDKFEAELRELDINRGNASEEIREKEDKISELRQTIEGSKELFDEINAFLKERNMSKVDFIKTAYELIKNNQ